MLRPYRITQGRRLPAYRVSFLEVVHHNPDIFFHLIIQYISIVFFFVDCQINYFHLPFSYIHRDRDLIPKIAIDHPYPSSPSATFFQANSKSTGPRFVHLSCVWLHQLETILSDPISIYLLHLGPQFKSSSSIHVELPDPFHCTIYMCLIPIKQVSCRIAHPLSFRLRIYLHLMCSPSCLPAVCII